MDFEKIVEFLPFGVTIWRAESSDPKDFRLVYANSQASKDFRTELFNLIGKKIDESFPEALKAHSSVNLPEMWMQVALTEKQETVVLSFFDKTAWYEIHMIPLGKGNVASIYKNITSERKSANKADKAIAALKYLETDLDNFRKRRSGEHRFPSDIRNIIKNETD